MNIPTKITVARIALVVTLLLFLFVLGFIPDLPLLYLGRPEYGINIYYFITFVIFVIAASTDYVDGHLARKWNQVTDLGKFLDPVADKLLVDSLLIYLILPHFGASLTIPTFCVIVMIVRDLVVDALRFIAAGKGVVLAANIFGKVKTVLQMIAIPLVLLNGWPFSYFDLSFGAFRIASIFVYLATAASLLSGVIYVVSNLSVLKEKK